MKVILEFNYPDDEDNLKRFVQVIGNREWVGLTDAELAEFSDMKLGSYDLCLEVEALLKERNT